MVEACEVRFDLDLASSVGYLLGVYDTEGYLVHEVRDDSASVETGLGPGEYYVDVSGAGVVPTRQRFRVEPGRGAVVPLRVQDGMRVVATFDAPAGVYLQAVTAEVRAENGSSTPCSSCSAVGASSFSRSRSRRASMRSRPRPPRDRPARSSSG